MAVYIVICELQIFSWINIGYVRYDNMVSINVQMFVIGNINFFIFFVEDSYQCGEFFFCGVGEILVYKWIIGILFEQVLGD